MSLTASRIIAVNAPDVTFSGAVSNSTAGKGITTSGTGNLYFTGAAANTFTGPFIVNSGTVFFNKNSGVSAIGGALTIGDNSGGTTTSVVVIGAANQMSGTTAAVTVNSDGQLNLQTFNETIGALTINGGSIIGTGRLDLGGNMTAAGSATADGSISANLGLNGTRTFTITDSGGGSVPDLTISGVISDGTATGSFTKAGAGMAGLDRLKYLQRRHHAQRRHHLRGGR